MRHLSLTAALVLCGLILMPTVAWETSVSKNLAIQITAGQSPTVVSFSPASPVNVSDAATAGTVISQVQVTTSDGQPFAGTVSISAQSVAGMTALSSSTLPSNLQVASINSGDDGSQTVTVQATENGVTRSATFTVNVTAASALPPGVTLSAIDGETMTGNVMSHNYYARNGFTNAASSTFNSSYNNGGWDDPRFFPIADDFPFYSGNSTTTYKTLGMNTAHRITGGTDVTFIRSAGIYIIDDGGGTNEGAELVGWHLDEPADWTTILNFFQGGVGTGWPGRFAHVAFTWNQLFYGTISGAPGDSSMPYVMSSPISTSDGNRHINLPADDEYWFAASATGFGQQNPCAHIYNNGSSCTTDQMARGDHYGDIVDTMRGWMATTTPQGFPAPNCPYIETEDGLVTDAGFRRILPQEFNWAALSTIVHGARCLLYFGTTSNYGTGSTFGFSQSILSGASVSMYNQAIATNSLVANLAPIINSPFAIGYASVSPAGYVFPTATLSLANGIDIAAKYYTGGSYTNSTGTFGNGFYIVSTVRGSAAQTNISATFTLNGAPSKTIPVVGESRNVTSNSSGVFTDTFANAYTVHMYGPIPYP
jgi:hypothetical protein